MERTRGRQGSTDSAAVRPAQSELKHDRAENDNDGGRNNEATDAGENRRAGGDRPWFFAAAAVGIAKKHLALMSWCAKPHLKFG